MREANAQHQDKRSEPPARCPAGEAAAVAAVPSQSLRARRRATEVACALAVALFATYASLLLTSDPLSPEQRRQADRAIDLLDSRGFRWRAFLLRHVVSFRSTDNWLNASTRAEDAYGATNKIFSIVTLYQDFFDKTADDTERAAILLHESYHVTGSGESGALRGVWVAKQQVGWDRQRYARTGVFEATHASTVLLAPELFTCGEDRLQDCYYTPPPGGPDVRLPYSPSAHEAPYDGVNR